MTRGRVIIVGGGAAGLMAAGQAAMAGAEVLLLEKMDRPGKKLSITGKGRCNLTNMAEAEEFISHFRGTGRFLRSAFARFFSPDLIAFFESLGVQTVTERGGRVFPASGEARLVVQALVNWVQKQGVEIVSRARVDSVTIENGCVTGVRRAGPDERMYRCDAVVVATGGASYPGTGSTGDGYAIAKAAGHSLEPIRPALVPLNTAGDVAARLQGLSLRNVRVRVLVEGKAVAQAFGEMLFTHFGVSGPIILSLSGCVVDALRAGSSVELAIDLKPALDEDKLEARLLRDFDAQGKKHFRTLLKGLLPQTLIPICIEHTRIPADRRANQITSEERRLLQAWLKDFRIHVKGHRSLAAAIVTAGGISTREVNPRTMESKLVQGLYFAGEVLDVDADTGGYNLQAAFSTGWVAGRAAAQSKT